MAFPRFTRYTSRTRRPASLRHRYIQSRSSTARFMGRRPVSQAALLRQRTLQLSGIRSQLRSQSALLRRASQAVTAGERAMLSELRGSMAAASSESKTSMLPFESSLPVTAGPSVPIVSAGSLLQRAQVQRPTPTSRSSFPTLTSVPELPPLSQTASD